MGSIGRGCGWERFNATIVLAAYSHNSIAMMLPPGNDSTSGSNVPPILWMRAAIRPAPDSIKFIMSVSYTADPRKLPEQHMPGQLSGLKKIFSY
jgi:hypothetical protein